MRPTVARGWTAFRLAVLSSTAREHWLAVALSAAKRALDRDPSSAVALELRGTVLWESQRNRSAATRDSAVVSLAIESLRTAINSDSTLASAWGTLSQLLRWQGEVSEANIVARTALRMDAYLESAGDIISQLYRSSMMLERVDSARAWCDRGRAMLPGDWRFVECELTLMHVDPRTASPTRAWELVGALESMDPPALARELNRPYSPIYRRLTAAAISAFAGDRARARLELQQALATANNDSTLRVDVLFDAAWVELGLGNTERATELLQAFVTIRPQSRAAVLQDPLLRRLGIDLTRLNSPKR